VKELLKPNSICESYAQMKKVFFLTHSVQVTVLLVKSELMRLCEASKLT